MLSNILILISGLGVFLFATKLLSTKLETLGGNKLRKKINQFSNNRFKAFGFGFLLTIVFQSTTASVVMVSSFTSVGMLTLFQAISLIIGVNVASAVPAYLISFQSFGVTDFFCAITIVGAILYIFAKKSWVKNMAQAFVGFGLMFVGLMLMKDSMSFILTEPSFISFFSKITNPALLIFLGAAFAILLQSSLGTTALVLSLIGTATVPGVISASSAIYIVFGALLGSSITTAIIASLSSNLTGKRAAIFHVFFSCVVCLIFGLLSLTNWVEACFGWIAEPSFQVITAYFAALIFVAILLIPFVKTFSVLLCKIIRPINRKRKNPLEVSDFTDEAPAVSIVKASKSLFVFYNEVRSIYKRTTDYIFSEEKEPSRKILRRIQDFNEYLTRFSSKVSAISSEDSQTTKDLDKILFVIKHIERINHNCKKIVENLTAEKKITFSARLNKFTNRAITNTTEMFELCQLYIKDIDCLFLLEDKSSYDRFLELSKLNSEVKLSAKAHVIENAAKSRAGMEKNTTYMEITSYLNMISNNLSDIVFMLSADNISKLNYEQIALEELNTETNENQEEKKEQDENQTESKKEL